MHFDDLIACYAEKNSVAQTSISITTGVLTAETDGIGSGFAFAAGTASTGAGDVTALVFDATGSLFETA